MGNPTLCLRHYQSLLWFELAVHSEEAHLFSTRERIGEEGVVVRAEESDRLLIKKRRGHEPSRNIDIHRRHGSPTLVQLVKVFHEYKY